MSKPLTGRTVFLFTAAAFGVIIAVNVTMAVQAVRTFPGLEVKNSYVASQQFEAKRDAQDALGWTVSTEYVDGHLTLVFNGEDGQPVTVHNLQVLIGRTTEAREDQRPEFALVDQAYTTPLDLARGKWMLQVSAEAEDGTAFHQRLALQVRG